MTAFYSTHAKAAAVALPYCQPGNLHGSQRTAKEQNGALPITAESVSTQQDAEMSRLRTQLSQTDRERHSLLDMLLQILRQNAMRLRQSPGRHGHGGLQPHEQQAR